jgi:ParB family chromosome partitioning protein
MAKRKLGRGLEMLIAPQDAEDGKEVVELDPGAIERNPRQPRQRFGAGELNGLKASIAKEGILQPILVRRVGEGYQLVAGERRLRAAKELKMDSVPAIVVDVPEERLLEVALIENIHREDLNPIELAQAYRQLMELRLWTQESLADQLGVGRSAVGNTLRLLELPDDMQAAVARKQISMGHAKVLLSAGDEQAQRLLFEKIAEENLTVRDLESERDQAAAASAPESEGKGKDRKKGRTGGGKQPYILSLEEELGEALGTRVRIRERGGRGALSIEFYTQDDFERLRRILVRRPEE